MLAEWHEHRAGDLDRAAGNAETALWRNGCQRRAAFHRMSGDYLRALHADLVELRKVVLPEQEPEMMPSRLLPEAARADGE